MGYVIEVEGLTKSFGSYPALRGLDFKVSEGESLVLLGPNGAGKTTLLKILATIMNPSSGKLLIAGLNAKTDAEKVRSHIGVVAHQVFFYSNLTAFENLEFYSRMYGVRGYRERIAEIVEMVGLTPRINDRVGTFSRGMQQRLSIARALLHKPDIIFLDEPETGLDQEALSMLWRLVRGEEKEKRTVVLTTHSLERALEMGDRFMILNRGKIAHEAARKGLDLPGLRQVYRENTGGRT